MAHQEATQCAGRCQVNGDWSTPRASFRRRKALLEEHADGSQVWLKLREDTLAAYAEQRAAAVDEDGNLPEKWTASGALGPATHFLERIVAGDGKATFTLKRSCKRQGRKGRTSRMEVRSLELEPGFAKPVGFVAAVSLLDRYQMVLEAVANPQGKGVKVAKVETSPDSDEADADEETKKTAPKKKRRKGKSKKKS